MRICSFDGCGRKYQGRGYCGGHLQQLRAGKELKPLNVRRKKADMQRELSMGVLTCRGCDRQLPLDQFPKNPGVMGVRSRCRECENERQLGNRYGLTREAWNRLLDQQDGRCAICRTDDPGGIGSFMVDHDHACCPGEQTCGLCVRSLLCSKCNFTVGFIESHPDLIGALDYVQRNHVQLPEKYYESAAEFYGWLRAV